jgi:endonuclease YncB( thermonuclease family)
MLRLLGPLLILITSSALAESVGGTVVSVTDGDSLTISSGQKHIRIRLVEIDAPELGQAFGQQSRRSLASLCLGKPARLVWNRADRYGRALGRVWCDGTYVNAEQVRRGMAWVFDRYVKDRGLYELQVAAKTRQVGLWTDTVAVAPWEWRRLKNRNEERSARKPSSKQPVF